MPKPILSKKSARMEVGDIVQKMEYGGDLDAKYTVRFNKKDFVAIPLVTSTPFSAGDKVIILFQDTDIEDTPFIVGKFNQKSVIDEKILPSFKSIEKPKNHDLISLENKGSFINIHKKNDKVVIGNKNNPNSQIIVDNDKLIIGGQDMINFMEDYHKKNQDLGNSKTTISEKDLNFKTNHGKFKVNSSEAIFLTTNYSIKNKSEMELISNHINVSASFIEFNAITPKGYDLKEKNAYSFFAVMGNFAISLGTGDFKLKSVSPLSKFEFLISPLTPFSDAKKSIGGFSIEKTETLISHLLGASTINLKLSAYENKVLFGASSLNLKASKFEVSTMFGLASLELSLTKFKITIAGNSMELTPTGLKIKSGDIEADMGDVKAMKKYSLMKHKHPTAVPGGPSPPTPG